MIELPTEVVGFHGTKHAALPHLLAGDIRQSDQHFEWLGTGFYLWQDSPWRAQAWAVDRFGDDAAVVAARVSLDGCLDLLNPHWHQALNEADDLRQRLPDQRTLAGEKPAQWESGPGLRRHQLVLRTGRRGGPPIRSVRAIFEEGDPIFEASAIRTLSHVQTAVRDPGVILEMEELRW